MTPSVIPLYAFLSPPVNFFGFHQPLLFRCHLPPLSCPLPMLKHHQNQICVPAWICLTSSILVVFAFFSFGLEAFFYYSRPQDGKTSRPAGFLSAYLYHFPSLKLLERFILFRLLLFLQSNSILSSPPGRFTPWSSPLDQILHLSHSILNGLHKTKPGSSTILPTINFSKVFDSVLLSCTSFILAVLSPSFV